MNPSPTETPERARLNYLLPLRSAKSPAPPSPDASTSDLSSDVRSAVPFLWEQTPGRCKSSASAADFYLHCTPPPSPPAAAVTLASLFQQSSPDPSSAASPATSDALTATDNALDSSQSSPRETVPRSSSYARHVIVNRFLPAAHAICATDSPAVFRGDRSFAAQRAPSEPRRNPVPVASSSDRHLAFFDSHGDDVSTDEDEDEEDDDDTGIIASMGACGISCTFRVAGTHFLFSKKPGARRRRLIRPAGKASLHHLRDKKHQWSCGELQKEANKGNYQKSKSLPLHELMVRENDQSLCSQANEYCDASMMHLTYPDASQRSRSKIEKTFDNAWSDANNDLNVIKGNDDILNNRSSNVLFPPLPKSPSNSWLEKAIPKSLKSPSPLSRYQNPKDYGELTKWQTIVMKANHLHLDHLRSSKELLWEAKNTEHTKE